MPPQQIILDAEMVAYSERREAIDGWSILIVSCHSNIDITCAEFWRIRGLIARTAQGPRAGMVSGQGEQTHESHSLYVRFLTSINPSSFLP